MPIKYMAILLAALVIDASAGNRVNPLTEEEAKAAIESHWSKVAIFTIPLGPITISHGESNERNIQKRRFNSDDLKYFLAFQAAGLVDIQEKKNLTREFTGWNDFFQMSQNGVGSEVAISLTAKGKRLNRSQSDYASFSEGQFSITKIISIEELQKDFDRYCLVNGFHSAKWVPEIAVVKSKLGKVPQSSHRKFRALFRHDKFTGNWALLALDIADVDTPFSHNSVQRALDSRK